MAFWDNKPNLLKVLKLACVLIFLYLFLKYVGGLFLPFVIGYILCLILYPLYKIFHNTYNIPKHISSILCICTLVFLTLVIGVGIIGQIIQEGKEFVKELPIYLQSIKSTFDEINGKISNLMSILPDGLETPIKDFTKNVSFVMGEFLGNGLKNTSIKVIKKVPNALMITIISLISCYLMIIDKENIQNFILKQIPKKYKDKFEIIKSGLGTAILGYIKAQAIIMCLISIICFFGLMFLKIPYALFIAVIIAMLDALPVFGSGFILWPWALYNVITKNYGLSIGLIVI